MLTCVTTISFHHKALHVVIELLPCCVRHVLMLVVSILHLHYSAATQTDQFEDYPGEFDELLALVL
jgi:hypothetical protein